MVKTLYKTFKKSEAKARYQANYYYDFYNDIQPIFERVYNHTSLMALRVIQPTIRRIHEE